MKLLCADAIVSSGFASTVTVFSAFDVFLDATVSTTREWFMESVMETHWFCTKSTCKACLTLSTAW